jgi:hypothetical protein
MILRVVTTTVSVVSRWISCNSIYFDKQVPRLRLLLCTQCVTYRSFWQIMLPHLVIHTKYTVTARVELLVLVKMTTLFWVVNTVWTARCIPTFQRNIPSSSLKLEAVCFFETLVCTDEFTRCHNTEQHRYTVRLLYHWHCLYVLKG